MTIFITLVTTTDDSSFPWKDEVVYSSKLPESTGHQKTLSFMEI